MKIDKEKQIKIDKDDGLKFVSKYFLKKFKYDFSIVKNSLISDFTEYYFQGIQNKIRDNIIFKDSENSKYLCLCEIEPKPYGYDIYFLNEEPINDEFDNEEIVEESIVNLKTEAHKLSNFLFIIRNHFENELKNFLIQTRDFSNDWIDTVKAEIEYVLDIAKTHNILIKNKTTLIQNSIEKGIINLKDNLNEKYWKELNKVINLVEKEYKETEKVLTIQEFSDLEELILNFKPSLEIRKRENLNDFNNSTPNFEKIEISPFEKREMLKKIDNYMNIINSQKIGRAHV